MLIYHPAYDAFHCLFRLLTISEVHRDIEILKIRIIDFYILFPAEIRNVKLPKEFSEAKAWAKREVNRYRGPVHAGQAFREIEQIQMAAIGALAAAELIERDFLETGILRRTEKAIPYDLKLKMGRSFEECPEVANFVVYQLGTFPLKGDGGLKHRTGLLEYRYDNA